MNHEQKQIRKILIAARLALCGNGYEKADTQGKTRNNTIQIMRGIAIAIVLLRHAIAQVHSDTILDGVEQVIICFHMPVFFMIAGYLFQNGTARYSEKGNFFWIKRGIY